ncbi:hypothetical protein [Streptomyces sp. SID2888]|uniref:hypothetical protein n=1 Tax=Streptomyces sp. SID2888 TaxID=2690256 RepID=UPI00136CCFE8|nr:hypothetical protein [Streptomyces sp. SID2888]MYV46248.1 hypothetical protein [Streptomyces sp. SID2888]
MVARGFEGLRVRPWVELPGEREADVLLRQLLRIAPYVLFAPPGDGTPPSSGALSGFPVGFGWHGNFY